MSFYSDNASDSTSQASNSNSSQPDITITSSNSAERSKDYSTSIYNRPNYKLEANSDSPAYIFKNGLFTRTLQPINISKEREILVQCTT